MADFTQLTQAIQDLNATLDQELTEIQQVIDTLSADTMDQANVDAAVAQLETIRSRLAAAVMPPEPPQP